LTRHQWPQAFHGFRCVSKRLTHWRRSFIDGSQTLVLRIFGVPNGHEVGFGRYVKWLRW
jgi:hypothetical protein